MATKSKRTKPSKPAFLKLPDKEDQTPPTPNSHLQAVGGVPDDVGDIDAFVRAERKAMLPRAIREKKWQLYFGSDAQRDKVASELLEMEGYGAKREAGPPVQPAIVLVNMPSPFARKVTANVVVEGESRALPEGEDKS